MLGNLHIEILTLSCLEGWIEDSAEFCNEFYKIVQSFVTSITTFGKESLCRWQDVVEFKYAHQVTAKSLHVLKKSAFDNYVHESSNQKIFEEWRDKMETLSSIFLFWSITSKM